MRQYLGSQSGGKGEDELKTRLSICRKKIIFHRNLKEASRTNGPTNGRTSPLIKAKIGQGCQSIAKRPKMS